MGVNQFGIKLRDSRNMLWVISQDQSLIALVNRLKDNKITILTLVGGKEVSIHVDGIIAICGPNDASTLEQVF